MLIVSLRVCARMREGGGRVRAEVCARGGRCVLAGIGDQIDGVLERLQRCV
jgi:hypothetical protein